MLFNPNLYIRHLPRTISNRQTQLDQVVIQIIDSYPVNLQEYITQMNSNSLVPIDKWMILNEPKA